MGINDTTTLLRHPYILCHFAATYTNVLVACREGLWKAVGSVVVGAHVVHLTCMESELCCGLLQCSCYTEHGRYGLS